MGAIFDQAGVLRTTFIGNAKIINVKIRNIFDITKRYMEKDIGFLLTSESRRRLKQEMNI